MAVRRLFDTFCFRTHSLRMPSKCSRAGSESLAHLIGMTSETPLPDDLRPATSWSRSTRLPYRPGAEVSRVRGRGVASSPGRRRRTTIASGARVMAGRPHTAIGTYGQIGVRRQAGRFLVATRYRDADGRLRVVTARGESQSAAKANLKLRLLNRSGCGTSGMLSLSSSFGDLVALWLADLELQDLVDQTKGIIATISACMYCPPSNTSPWGRSRPVGWNAF